MINSQNRYCRFNLHGCKSIRKSIRIKFWSLTGKSTHNSKKIHRTKPPATSRSSNSSCPRREKRIWNRSLWSPRRNFISYSNKHPVIHHNNNRTYRAYFNQTGFNKGKRNREKHIKTLTYLIPTYL